MSQTIKHLFHINAPREEVYKAITSIEGLKNWWTVQTSGNAGKDGIVHFEFGEMGGPKMRVTDATENQSVSWECIDSPHGWTGHIFSFHLDENDGKTRVRFAHDGWQEASDFYAICSFSWGRYMESLRQLCQTGTGEAFGSATYRR